MRTSILSGAAALLIVSSAFAQTPEVPPTAKQLKGNEIAKYLDGKTFALTVYDAGGDLTATIRWDWKAKKNSGNYVFNGKKGTFENDWTIKGDTNCGEKNSKGKWVCQKIFVDGSTMYEVTSKGKLHAVSVEK